MSQEMFLRKIPEDMRPWECNVNGVKYVYPAGTEQNVPAEVAAIIDAYWENQAVDYPETGISFNDLRDRPFYESTEVLFDQRVELTQFTYVHSEELAISDGDTVKVTWNGTEYECTASIVSEDGMEAVVVGNLFGAGTEPFFIGVGSSFGGTAIMDMSGILTEVTVKIEKTVIHTIDPKFLPGGGGGVVIVTESATNPAASGVATASMQWFASISLASIAKAVYEGKQVYFYYNDEVLLPFAGGVYLNQLAEGVMATDGVAEPHAIFGMLDDERYYQCVKVYADNSILYNSFTLAQ